MDEIYNYENSSAQATDEVESSEENSDNGDEETNRDRRDTGDEDDDPLSLPTCAREISGKSYNLTTWMDEFEYMRLFLCQFPVYLDGTWQRAIILSKVVHPYIIPTVCETKQNYMATLKPYTDEVKDTIIDDLKANLKGVTVLTSAEGNVEDEYSNDHNPNQSCCFPRLAEEVDEEMKEEEMKEEERQQDDEKMTEKEEEKMEENDEEKEEEKLEEKKEEESEEENLEEKKN
uniref:Mature-parasite-infected erythrocyte surface antigen n=1 Tax=Solanum tuberosum TaxID=4113 RepID=M1DSK2_SOLTU